MSNGVIAKERLATIWEAATATESAKQLAVPTSIA
jgi:hypothetical protein